MSVEAADLLGLRVERKGTRLGTVTDVFSDPLLARRLGFEVTGADGERLFLPSSTCRVHPGHVESLVLNGFLASSTLVFYRERGASWNALRNRPVVQEGRRLGKLEGIRFDDNGSCEALIVRDQEGAIRELSAPRTGSLRSPLFEVRIRRGLPATDAGHPRELSVILT